MTRSEAKCHILQEWDRCKCEVLSEVGCCTRESLWWMLLDLVPLDVLQYLDNLTPDEERKFRVECLPHSTYSL